MAAAQLWLLGIFAIQFRPNRVQQLQIRLLGPLLEGFDERPAERSTRLSVLERIGSAGKCENEGLVGDE